MTEQILTTHEHHEAQATDTITFGFWIYLMTDLIMFAVLFACYAVLHTATAGGPTTNELFNLPFVLIETLLLLMSSFTIGLAILASHQQKIRNVISWLVVTGILGATFLSMELYEFNKLIAEGSGFTRSAFLSSYFSLVGTHGVHIAVGLLWIIIMIIATLRKGLTASNIRKITLLSLFWHFLDIVWIFIFTIVYLMGVIH